MLVDPLRVFSGVILLTAPHMDDCVLGCGGLMARLPYKERIHVVYATDGTASPASEPARPGSAAADLCAVRMAEARAAMGYLGVPQANVHFLNLPDGQLRNHEERLRRSLEEAVAEIRPNHILAPFRYDRHTDHLALNRVVTAAQRQGAHRANLLEYFIYYRWRLLRERDVRKYIHPRHLLAVDITDSASQKRAALAHFKSQTTVFFSWQERPVLTPDLLDEVSRTPEVFLKYDASAPGPAVFAKSAVWVRLAHKLEPLVKDKKDRVAMALSRVLQRDGRSAP